ncbi:cadherin-like domain-containing protein [Sphingomonas lenta]|uniref:RapA2 cadherin-like domain-containing protein n=1 Tax=Sphingomonas lenta TaxID=1141887 RepID=A0A2A2SAR8_9SPHN|nr:cadherin-like domain-containing protein [Sphingomonas lenta]PAX06346.1 hypothetical protein CKY28_17865 [Sphingomonas lenta]
MAIKNTVVNGEAFMQGKYLALGVNSSGSLGTKQNVPGGIFSDASNGFTRLGLYADLDGFGVGRASTVTEAMLDGTPTEGFTIGYKVGGAKYVHQNQERTARTHIDGATSDRSAGGVAKTGWTGTTTEKLAVDQTISLTDDGKFVRVDIVLTNKSAAAMTDLVYMRSIDPDHGATFGTENKIVAQGGANGALVAAYSGATPFFYYAQDPRAVVSTTAGYRSVDPYTAVVTDAPQVVGHTLKGDNVVNIAFDAGTLAAGATTKFTFYMGVTDNLDATIAAIKAGGGADVPTTTPPNAAPVAEDDAFALVAGATAKGNVLANDKDANGDALSVTIGAGPKNGALVLNKDGSFSYTATAGFTGVDSFTYVASDGKATDAATVTLTVTAPANTAPVARADSFSTKAATAVAGNVLANDTDAEGQALSATLVAGPANGTLSMAANGAFTYTPKAGFSGVDTFSYTASDGAAKSAAATVSVTVAAPTAPPPVVTPPVTTGTDAVLTRSGTRDGSAADNQFLSGADHRNSFFVDSKGVSGNDRITNFQNHDVLVTTKALHDGNADGVIGLGGTRVMLDSPSGGDMVRIDGVYALRELGMTAGGLHVYAKANVRPTGAIEGKLGADALAGDLGDAAADTFFFDTALDLDLGQDTIDRFGAKDVLVTTSALADGNGDGIISFGDGRVQLVGSTGAPDDQSVAGEAGSVALRSMSGAAVNALEFDGTVVHGDTVFYVYSLVGSAAGTDSLI